MTVGLYSPLPPAASGVADYSAALLTELRRHGRVEVAPKHCDVPLYHMGNNGLHAAVYRRALAEPGIVVLHDAVLNHFLLGQLNQPDYIAEFVYNYGAWNRDLAAQLWRGRAASASDRGYFEYPMLKRIAERSRAVIVHNPAAARAVRRHAPGARVTEIPHLFAMPALPGGSERLRWRQRLGIAPEAFLFGVFGYLRESKRLVTVLEAFRWIRAGNPRAALLVAGRFVSTDLERAVSPLLDQPGVARLPYLPEERFWLAASSVDACISLRYPATGETSGITIRLMGIGKPVLLTDSEEYARLPEGACLRVSSGPAERESLKYHMVLLTSMTEVAGAIGERGAGHIRAHHRVEDIAKLYWAFLCERGT